MWPLISLLPTSIPVVYIRFRWDPKGKRGWRYNFSEKDFEFCKAYSPQGGGRCVLMATAMALHLSAVVRAKPRSAPRRWLVELHENTVVGTTLKRLEWSPGLTAVIPRDILRSIILRCTQTPPQLQRRVLHYWRQANTLRHKEKQAAVVATDCNNTPLHLVCLMQKRRHSV